MPGLDRPSTFRLAVLCLTALAASFVVACGGDGGGGASCNDGDCVTPPPNFCDGDIAWSFLPFGACDGATCNYSPSSSTCEFGCTNGSCDDPPDLCEDVDCSAPAPACDGDTVVTIESDGRCNPDTGQCEFTDIDVDDCAPAGEICVRTDRGPECFLPAEHCSDGIRNGGESDIDCGGPDCRGCRPGAVCFEESDCNTSVCEGGTCVSASCTDSVRNGNETDRDCGGSCRPCRDSLRCNRGADCSSGVCTVGLCTPATCVDGVRNGSESDVDCGGNCEPCERGSACNRPTDCDSRSCRGDRCRAPACDDLVVNGDETDIDCGGECNRCAEGFRCSTDDECTTGWCNGAGVCAVRTCEDGLLNGPELDVDCGGDCGLCDDDQRCLAADNCVSGVCAGGFCAPATCIDRVQNGDETDVDCGGDDCSPCDAGEGCRITDDCADDGRCLGRVCVAPTCDDAVRNARETAVDCGGPDCAPCARNRTCLIDADCVTDICNDEGRCDIDRSCFDDIRNEDETDVDCGGDECAPCRDGWACDEDTDCVSGVCALGVYCAEPSCDDGVQNGLETAIDCGASCGLVGCPSDCAPGTQLYDLADFQLGAAFWQHSGEGDERPTFENDVGLFLITCDDEISGFGTDVVYRFDVTEEGNYRFDTGATSLADTDVPTGVAVLEGTCTAFENVACANVPDDGSRASATGFLEEGVYFIVIDTNGAVADVATWTLRVTRTF